LTEPTFLDAVIAALESARASTSGGAERAPAALLWPDEDREWQPIVAAAATRLPILTLGPYEPMLRRGPAYWLRCVIDGALAAEGIDPALGTPIAYLPGVPRSLLRAIENAPKQLQPIAELQYRGAVFSQTNGRDWSIRAFLQAAGSGGLGLDVSADSATRDAIRQARSALVQVPLRELIHATPLKASFFQALVAPDLARLALRWLDDPKAFEQARSPDQLEAFRTQFLRRFQVDPLAEGPVGIARALGQHDGDAWEALWIRYLEAPTQYPRIPDRLRSAGPAKRSGGLFDQPGSWPQINEAEEEQLRLSLTSLRDKPSAEARAELAKLAQVHAERTSWVWAGLGQAPLAKAVVALAELARLTAEPYPAVDTNVAIERYVATGWQADSAVMKALMAVSAAPALAAVEIAVRAVYSEWLDTSCATFQQSVARDGYEVRQLAEWPAQTCVIFTDGLRLDVGQGLAERLRQRSLEVELTTHLSALPSITSTAKAYVSPIVTSLGPGPGLSPAVRGGASPLTIEGLRKQLEIIKWQFLPVSETGDPSGRAWTELGDIDSLGHAQPAKLPHLLEAELTALGERIETLLAAGWMHVAVVTDHGWLFLPGGLPKTELPMHLTEKSATRKARCARLATGASTQMQTVPWTWDPTVKIAMPPGASAFEAGQVFEHGGLSLQECVTPVIVARRVGAAVHSTAGGVSIHWRGMRGDVQVEGAAAGATVDLRKKAGDVTTTLLSAPLPIAAGVAHILVEDPDLQGTAAFLVVIESGGNVIRQLMVTVGENE
jgi:hypothetical protein